MLAGEGSDRPTSKRSGRVTWGSTMSASPRAYCSTMNPELCTLNRLWALNSRLSTCPKVYPEHRRRAFNYPWASCYEL